MGPACAQAHLTGDLWMPLLCLLLSHVCNCHDPPQWRFTSSEVVIPRKVSHRSSGAWTQGQLAYKIHFRGQRYVVHMKVKKDLLPRHFPVITSNDQGALQEDYPFIPRDCYYYSYLEGVPGSMGTLDTCYGGLRGMLQVDDFTYEIKPLEASSKFEHVISLLVTEETAAVKCKIGKEDTNLAPEEAAFSETPRAGPVYFWWPHTKFLKLHYTVTNSFYNKMPNITQVIQYVVVVNSIVHSIYKAGKLDIIIHILCIWDKRDEVGMQAINANPGQVLSQFGLWKARTVYKFFSHDTSLVLTKRGDGDHYYFAFERGTCNPNWGVAYIAAIENQVFLSAGIAAHVIGHSLGLTHDGPGCTCFRRTACLMNSKPSIFDMMSNCSYSIIHERVNQWDPCLSAKGSPYTNFPYTYPRCGDAVTDEGEECDCGTFKDCLPNTCCTTECAYTVGSVCNDGSCCNKCKYASPGMTCRPKFGVCDLPEYCNGNTQDCPDDFYIQDGTPCSPIAICVQGNCSDRDIQCQALFGFKVKDAVPACYTKLNVIGDRFGNCGVRDQRGGAKPFPCELDDVFCGMLHCRDVKQIPGGGEHTTFHHIKVQDVKQESCFGYDVHTGMNLPELGLVVDGASCGPGRYCMKQNCTFIQDIGFDCNVSTCNYRGVCNNNRNCHCMKGWEPPWCNESGTGGSIDSGPPPGRERRLRTKIITDINMALFLIVFRAVLLLVAFIIAGGIQLKRYIEKQRKKPPDRKEGNLEP